MPRKSKPASEHGERVITRYDNRKLYDPAARRYVTLEQLARMIGRGLELRVREQRTGDDITSVILAQVILEGIKERTASIPRQVLTRLIRLGSAPRAVWSEWAGPQQAAARARQEAERIVSELLARGRLSLEDALGLRQEIARAVQGIVAEAQRSLEQRVHRLLERTERERGVHPTLEQFKERLLAFEASLEAGGRRLRASPAGRPRAARGKRSR